jgi:hypothetical protein
MLVEPAYHLYELVLLVLLKQEVEVDGQAPHLFVVGEDLNEESLFVLLEEGQGVLRHFDFLGSLEEFDRPQVDPVQEHPFWGVGPPTEEERLLIHSTDGLNDFF